MHGTTYMVPKKRYIGETDGMPNYRRHYEPGGVYFFTVVTHGRRPFLCEDRARPILRTAMQETRERFPFEQVAVVLLPDHLHCIWRMPEGDSGYSKRWSCIKRSFTKRWVVESGQEGCISADRFHHRNRGVWQARFWEHRIRDKEDFARHVNYIHYNPVKHGYAECPHAWAHSSFDGWVRDGVYGRDWGCSCDGGSVDMPDFTGMALATGE